MIPLKYPLPEKRMSKQERLEKAVYIEGNHLMFGRGQVINLDACKTHKDVTTWIYILNKRKGVTKDMINRFIDLTKPYLR
jgi:hypothetical protein